MTKTGIITEVYREITPYWFKRLVYNYKDVLLSNGLYYGLNSDKAAFNFVTNQNTRIQFGYNEFDYNIMTLGSTKSTDSDRILKLEHKGVEIRTGNPEWGAEPDKLYFVIMHGSIINQ